MNKETILNRLRTDFPFALGFAIDNNPEQIFEILNSFGFALNGSGLKEKRESAFQLMLSLAKGGNAQIVRDVLNKTFYLNNAGNYTAGFADYFKRTTPANLITPQMQAGASAGRFSWDGLLAGIGTSLTTYAAYASAENASEVIYTPEQLEEKKKEEEEKEKKEKQKKMIYIIGGALLLVILIILIIWLIKRSKKQKTQ